MMGRISGYFTFTRNNNRNIRLPNSDVQLSAQSSLLKTSSVPLSQDINYSININSEEKEMNDFIIQKENSNRVCSKLDLPLCLTSTFTLISFPIMVCSIAQLREPGSNSNVHHPSFSYQSLTFTYSLVISLVSFLGCGAGTLINLMRLNRQDE